MRRAPTTGVIRTEERLVEALQSPLEVLAEEARRQLGRAPARGEAFEGWRQCVASRVWVGASDAELREEFARQTAYVSLVRLLLVRLCEDKGLCAPRAWQEQLTAYRDYATGSSYDYLPSMARGCAQGVFTRLFGSARTFDWYVPGDEALQQALRVLKTFHLEHLETDVIGAAYGRDPRGGKHQQGRYYTPRPVVQHMLDLAGWRGTGAMGRRLCDLACGSGSFLVEACQRLLERYRGEEGRIPQGRLQEALQQVQRSLCGMDLNPFACFLAETNLLIQVLELVQRATQAGVSLELERFSISCQDSLLSPGEQRFEVLVGNPPYVRADERAVHHLGYRRLVEQQEWFTTRYLKWDLYVPFVEQYTRLLSDHPAARCCLVTIESLGKAPYAQRLRHLLARQTMVYEILFTQGLALFEDASWQDNIVFSFSRGSPPATHRVHRRLARQRTETGALLAEELDQPLQQQLSPERLFNPRREVQLELSHTVRWEQICYVSKGMVLHSHERLGARHRPFRRDELIADSQSAVHTRRYLAPDQVLSGGIGSTRWLEYGEHTRCPGRVSRPTFPELYERPKVLFGTFKGVAVDEGEESGFLVVPDSVRLSVRWELLEGVENRALAEARRKLEAQGLYDPRLSRGLSEWYLCALALSEPIATWLEANRRSMKEHVYPGDIRAIPVKVLPAPEQQPFIHLARERHQLWNELKERVAGLLAASVAALPGALAEFIDAQAQAVRQRLRRMEEINARIDELAWRLYRP